MSLSRPSLSPCAGKAWLTGTPHRPGASHGGERVPRAACTWKPGWSQLKEAVNARPVSMTLCFVLGAGSRTCPGSAEGSAQLTCGQQPWGISALSPACCIYCNCLCFTWPSFPNSLSSLSQTLARGGEGSQGLFEACKTGDAGPRTPDGSGISDKGAVSRARAEHSLPQRA